MSHSTRKTTPVNNTVAVLPEERYTMNNYIYSPIFVLRGTCGFQE